jgi:integral membrane protein
MTSEIKKIKWLKRFRAISIVEGMSFLLLLFIAMPLKYIFDYPLAVKYVGWAHGALFMLYVLILFPVARILKWSFKKTFIGLVASVLPFGPFIFDRNLKKDEQLMASEKHISLWP